MDRLLDQLLKDLPSALRDLWQSVSFWRPIAIVSWVAIVLAYTYRARLLAWLSGSRDHDRAIFERFDELLPERFVRDVYDELEQGSWTTDQSLRCIRSLRFLELEENRFLTRQLRSKRIRCSGAR